MPSLADLPPPDAAQAPSPAAEPAPEAAAPETAPAPAALPSPFDDVVQGQIPAVLIPAIPKGGKPNEVHDFVANNLQEMTAAGLDYKELHDDSLVLYNPSLLSPAKLDQAIKNGTIHKIAAAVTKLGDADAPAPAPGAVPAPAPGAAPAPAAMAGPAGPLSNAPMPSGPPPKDVNVPGLNTARMRVMGAAKQTSPIMPSPVPGRLAQRAV